MDDAAFKSDRLTEALPHEGHASGWRYASGDRRCHWSWPEIGPTHSGTRLEMISPSGLSSRPAGIDQRAQDFLDRPGGKVGARVKLWTRHGADFTDRLP